MTRLNNVRIARVSTVPYFMATQLKRQIDDLVAAGADVTVITSDGEELSRFKWTDRLRYLRVEIPRAFQPVKDTLALLELARIFRREKFDIVHSTTPKAGVLCAIAGVLARVPIRLHTFTGQPWVTLSGPVAMAARFADRIIGRLATRCYADSVSQRDFLIENSIVSPGNVSVLGSGSLAGVDLDRFNRGRFSQPDCDQLRAKLGIPAGSRIVLFVGRICADKGIAELVTAFDAVLEAGIDAHLVLVGPIDEREGGAGLLEQSRSPDRVHHVGYTSEPERYMAIADVMCLASYREGFGTVVIEAASMGIPTVGTDIYGLRDAIVDGRTGVLVPIRDAKALAQAVIHVLREPGLLTNMGTAARARCEAEFDAHVVSGRVLGEYRRLMALP